MVEIDERDPCDWCGMEDGLYAPGCPAEALGVDVPTLPRHRGMHQARSSLRRFDPKIAPNRGP